MTTRVLTVATSLMIFAAASGAQTQSAAPPANRAALEQQFRERAAKLMQQRLGLNESQMTQLEQSNRKFAPQLAQIAGQERETRRQLRLEMAKGNSANQQHVSDLLDASIRYQQQRITLVQAEQQDLARFLLPVQRARYLAFQSQLRQRANELAGQNGQRARAGKRRGPGPSEHSQNEFWNPLSR